MPSSRNPSFNMTDAQVDDVVDRLLRGKYEKHHPVRDMEVVRAGLMNSTICRDYVAARWGQRSRWSSDRSEGLSAAGITMRTNKLNERISPHVSRAMDTDNNELVWKVYENRSYETVCYAVGSRTSARQWAWTLFGWTLPEGTTLEKLRTDLHGGGGILAASSLNMHLVKRINDQIKSHEERAARETASAERLRGMVDAVMGAAAHLASGATGG